VAIKGSEVGVAAFDIVGLTVPLKRRRPAHLYDDDHIPA
jgi:hypothetical protein